MANCSSLLALNLSRNKLRGALPFSIGNLSSSLELLAMDTNQLSGSIPSTIGMLINLQMLDLSYNLLDGTIPQEIGNLQKLYFLSLSVNQLSGTLPLSLGNLSNLQHIYLKENHFVGSIPSQFENLTSLVSVVLSENNFIGNIPSFFRSQLHLTRLSMGTNSLSGGIPPPIGDLKSLVELQLGTNNLTGSIPDSLWNLSSLEILNLEKNQLAGAIAHNIGHALPNLASLMLSDNNLHGQIPTSLSNCSSLIQISLSLNAFTGTVPTNLGNLKNLLVLELRDIGSLEARGSSAWAFLEGLANCTNLKVLDLATNYVGGILPAYSIANLSTTLSILYLKENNLSGGIPSEIKNLVGLKILNMYQNRLTGTIPTTIAGLQSLHCLELSFNELSGEIPSALGNLTLMNELHLEFNSFSGNIPPNLGNCKQLEILNLQNNKLIGSIPRQILAISSISRGLFMSNNSLTGSLNPAIGSLKNLESFSLANNNLAGIIPSSLGQCMQLRYIQMENNLFQGTIPWSLKELRGLEVLDLSHNQLSGKIPTFLETFDLLQYLNLSFNHFEGEVPKSGVFANTSLFSVFGNKNLCGGNPDLNLPPCSSQAMSWKHHSPHALLVASTTAVAGVVLFVLVFLIFTAWRYKPRKLLSSTQKIVEVQNVKFSYTELLKATNGFSLENLIGKGSFSSVYKGHIECYEHKIIAIKVLNLHQRGASRSFDAECKALRNMRHRNLLKILTTCSSIDYEGNDFKALIFEFMSNGSLDKWLHPLPNDDDIERRRLTLIQRINIAIEVASALDYLHHRGSMPIIHCDLKPSNILLDDDMVAHVGDFGLAKLVTKETIPESYQKLTESIVVKGSVGYVAPEYGMANQMSIKGDVYSFGIVLLEMFTGRRPTDGIFNEDHSLHQFVRMALPERVIDIADPQILSLEEDVKGCGDDIQHINNIQRHDLECIASVLKIGLLCSNESPTERIEIGRASKELHAVKDFFLMRERVCRCSRASRAI